jgi:hypothetical protein
VSLISSLPPLHKVRCRGGSADLSRFPDFLIAGPQRTGTTWIYHNLIQHPHIFLPPTKEIYYFSTLGRPDRKRYRFDYLEEYLGIFEEPFRARLKKTYDCLRKCGTLYTPRLFGEATATYATLEDEVIEDIACLNPKIRIVLMLRDPVERAWSHAMKELVRPAEPGEQVGTEQFLAFFQQPGQLKRAAYRDMVDKWRRYLPADQIYLGDYAEIGRAPRAFLEDLCIFLGTEMPAKFPENHLHERINSSTQNRVIPPDLLQWLEEHFREERAEYWRLLEEFDALWRQPLKRN